MKKLGAVFMVTVFALAGVGVSYAGFFDIIEVHGEVSTAYVDYEFIGWSGTWVWKVPDILYEMEIYQGNYLYDGTQYPLPLPEADAISYAKASAGDGSPYEVEVKFFNIFPLEANFVPGGIIRWEADFYLHYTGSIPGYLYPILFTPPTLPDGITFGWEAQSLDGTVIPWPYQMHYCDIIRIVIWIDIVQPVIEDSPLEGLGWDLSTDPYTETPLDFYMNFKLIQWNEEEYTP